MKKFISLSLICALLTPSVAYAENTVTGQPNFSLVDSAAIAPLKKNQPAPFTGVLLTPKAVATIITETETAKEKTEIEVTAAVKNAEAKKDFAIAEQKTACDTDKKILNASVDEKMQRIKVLEKTVKDLEDATPSRAFWTGVGFVGGVVVTVVTVFAVTQATK
jgi:hypothetical protein